MKKIIYIIKSRLHFYPPCVSQIRILKELGYDVEVLFGSCDINTIKILENEKIKMHNIVEIKDENANKIRKIIDIIKLRMNLRKKLKEYSNDNTIYWFGNAESAILMKGALKNKKYIVSLLELYDYDKLKGWLLHGIVEKSLKTTVCEENRAYLVKKEYNLNYVPTIFPNKPYNQITRKCINPSNDVTENIINKIKNDNVIIYQGYIWEAEELIELAKALNEIEKKYKLVLLGIDYYNSYEKVKKIYENCVFFPYVPAPLHLEITSYARIGLLYYRNHRLNNVYCAPNKIYEYSGFGIPMIGNNIPGLKYTIGYNRCGQCIEMTKEKFIDAINEIEKNYEEYSANAIKFYESCDSSEKMKSFLKEIEI